MIRNSSERWGTVSIGLHWLTALLILGLAVATGTALFGPESGAALATVVGVLVEVPVMLSVCSVCNRTRHWFPAAEPGTTAN